MKISLQHCRDLNVTWAQHNVRAMKWALSLQKTAAILCIHAFCPWLFPNDARERVSNIHDKMNKATK